MLSYVPITGRDPGGWVLAVHGIFGRGANLRTFARHLVQKRPDWGVLLVDAREHGRSLGHPPPHTIAAAAQDVAELARMLTAEGDAPVTALLGHSLGGKIVTRAALALADSLRQVWVVDSSPSARPEAFSPPRPVPRVLAMLEEVVPTARSRDAFIAEVKDRGFAPAIAQWLAMNYQRGAKGDWHFGLDLAAMRSLLESYYGDDVWSLYQSEQIPADIHVVAAERSSSLQPEELDRLAELAQGETGRWLHRMDTGHWVHAERPDELATLVARHLPEPGW